MTDAIYACDIDDILPDTGVCALINQQQVAIFRPDHSNTVYAISNYDPFSHANVLSRGLLGEHDGVLYVASPLNKKKFVLKTGQCLDDETKSVQAYAVSLKEKAIFVQCN